MNRFARDVPRGFSFHVAHEFFDALPVHKFVRDADGGSDEERKWHEILVDVNDKGDSLRFVKAKERTPAAAFIDPGEEKNEVEICPQVCEVKY